MPKVSVCVEMVYDAEPFHERIQCAAAVGADGVEFWGWRGKDLETIESVAAEAEIPIVACAAGGTLTDLARVDEAVETIRESIETAERLGCPSLIATTGPDQEGLDRTTQRDAVVDVLSRVAPAAEEAGVTITLEPLNAAVDHPGTYLTSAEEGFEIVDRVGSERVKLLYDVYHQQITEGNVIATLTANVERVGHVHVADVPGRHEPGTGELNYENVLEALEAAGYDGYVGCEFSPVGDPDEAVATILEWR